MSAMRDAIAAELDKAVRNMQALAADAAMQAQLEQAVGLCTGALREGRKLLQHTMPVGDVLFLIQMRGSDRRNQF